jgi:hypothetical protein
MVNITENNFPLNVATKEYNRTIEVPENVWDVTYGEILLTYSANLGGLELRFPKLVCGFTMTHVENVYLKNIEEQLEELNSTFWECFQMNLTAENLALLNTTYWQLLQNYTALQGGLNELDNTRRVVTILAITTVFFVATTLYLVMRKPKQYL